MSGPSFGIDLGTTNVCLAVARAENEPPATALVPQVVHEGEVAERPLLPSFLYLPGPAELKEGAIALPWDPDRTYVVGAFAREQGARIPSRLVASAKSWLSHAGVDRREAILPWGAPEEVEKVSPVGASARYLAHLREAWDHLHPDLPLAEQDLVLTVPASFDAVARELTVEAARAAGLERLTLLEEPQAALYAWVAAHPDWRKRLSVGDLILVCDIGGGTTDFSLIAVMEEEGALELRRVAVGDHILLGGDNMDLALTYALRARLQEKGQTIDDWQLRALVHSVRQAKEQLFADESLAAAPVVIPCRGSRLIGGTLRTELDRATLESVLLDGFFPRVDADARPETPRRVALTALGLPYAHDPAFTRHLAAFLGRHAASTASLPPGVHAEGRSFLHPTAILFNGGPTKAAPVRARILEVLESWIAAEGGRPPKVLEGGDPDLAVARGAAYYGLVRRGRGVRIRGGSARSYYVGIERAELAVPGVPPRVDAICIAPFGMEEGSEITLSEPLGLWVGEPASFRFFASSSRRDDEVGTAVDPAELEELPPIETTLEGEAGVAVPVRLRARLTEVGTLELFAVDAGGREWRLEFQIER
ncbi:MAG TPA: Hsp70 family protein [Fredinandcohnia sp.]|nr:Hsp70 family protein [Fredinandcohnia sp.]